MLGRAIWVMILSLALMPLHARAVTLVEQGEARAVVVTADEPTPIASYAVEELVEHIAKATGVELDVVRESELTEAHPSRVYVGLTEAAAAEGIDAEALQRDVFVLRTVGDDLYVLGNEGDMEPFETRQSGMRNHLRGTLFGVYELLERYVGVRWLWPGELGTHVPETDTLAIDEALDERVAPALDFRRGRISHLYRQVDNPDPALTRLGFTEQAAADYLEAMEVHVARHRMGYTKPKPRVGHHFAGWWQEHGEEHPEWFMLNEDGERGPRKGARDWNVRHVAVCVSNPDLHRYIVEEDWDGGDVLSLGEVDARVFCQCEDCLAWDGPQPEDPPAWTRRDHEPRLVSDRYARFWKTIQAMARERNPDVTVTTFLYWNYLPAPTGDDIELNENVYGEFVPWTGPYVYFPMPEEREQWKREQWLKWRELGVTMAYRPNYFHGGYVMPNLSTWQAGEFYNFAYENGMVGFDWDSLYGHWAIQGPMMYMHMRLFAHPGTDIGEIREEYFSAFGPAAPYVEAYFDYWEDYSGVRGGNPNDVVSSYRPAVFEPAQEHLDAALAAAQQADRDVYAQRVEFLQVGFEQAKLAARFVRATDRGDLPDDEQRLEVAREALRQLIELRRENEHLFFADLVDAANRENRWVEVDPLLEAIDE